MYKANQQNAIRILILIVAVPSIVLAQQTLNIPSLSQKPVHFLIVDSTGNPVNKAFIEASRHGPGNATGYTNSQGRLTLQLTRGASLHVYVSKDGYYNTGGELWTGGMYKDSDKQLVAREVPDDFTITLKRIINPVPLIHFNYRGNAPKSDKPVGFDLESGDWLAPYGKGETVDILFHFHDQHIDAEGFSGTMSLYFPNPQDGIQTFEAARPFSREFGSDLAPPNVAPTGGYDSSLSKTRSHRSGMPYSGLKNDRLNYIIRTRSKVDAAGVLRQACYGWIQGEIEFDPRDPRGPQLAFTYYFNPDPDPQARSLEDRRNIPKER